MSIFQVDTDPSLYFLLFGEALLNDGVTFVLFEGLKELALVPDELKVPTSSFLWVLASFLTAPLGGVIVGVLGSWTAAFLTKYTRAGLNSITGNTILG